jgi:hypothetical protein
VEKEEGSLTGRPASNTVYASLPVREDLLDCISKTVCTWDIQSPDYGNAAYTNVVCHFGTT